MQDPLLESTRDQARTQRKAPVSSLWCDFRIGETDAHIARECPQFYFIAIGLNKDSIFKPVFDQRIQQFREAGLILKWTKAAMERAGQVVESTEFRDITTAPLKLQEMEGAFLVGVAFLSVCTLVCLFEMMAGIKRTSLRASSAIESKY